MLALDPVLTTGSNKTLEELKETNAPASKTHEPGSNKTLEELKERKEKRKQQLT